MNGEFYQPRSALFWAFVGLTVIGALYFPLAFSAQLQASPEGLLRTVPILLGVASIVVVILVRGDHYRSRRLKLWAAASLWGGFAGTYIAFFANRPLMSVLDRLLGDSAELLSSAIAGPLTEETLKGLGVAALLVLCSHTVYRPIHGFALGSMAGLGFQVIEDLFYALKTADSDPNSNVSGMTSSAIARSFTSFASHWEYTAFVGVGLTILLAGYLDKARGGAAPWSGARWSPGRRWASGLGFIATGYLLHAVWNLGGQFNQYVFVGLVFLKVLLVIGAYWWLWRWSIRHERQWVMERAEAGGVPKAEEVLGSPPAASAQRRVAKHLRRTAGAANAEAYLTHRRATLDALQRSGHTVVVD